MAKRFLTDEDKTELQNDLSGVQQIAENASKTVQEVSVVAQEAAENAKNAYSPLNKPEVVEIGARPNANLLHNWYFGNPVNRNGKTEYAGYGMFTIDRWKLWQSTGVVKVNDGLISLSSSTTDTSGKCYWNQPVSSKLRSKLEGNVCTLSIIARTNRQNGFSIPMRVGSGVGKNVIVTQNWGLYTCTETATFGEEG